jgi:membrane protease YdiL (CAAX protease family)
VLVTGALLPTLIWGRDLAGLGLRWGQVRQGLVLLSLGGACLLVVGLLCVALLRQVSIQPPLVPSVPKERWLQWVLFQFAYAAFPEELFFRGYVLSGSLCLLKGTRRMNASVAELVAILLSAGVFALSHTLILGNAASLLTFFPGLIFGWLFVKIGSLVPAVLMHGGANIGYAIMTGAFA